MISKKHIVTAVALTLALTSSTLADNKYSKEYNTCMKGPAVSQGATTAILNCGSKEIKYQDKKLNSAYKALKKNLSKDRQKELLTAQRLWIKYRDANCGFYNAPDGGTMHRVFAQECFLSATQSRAEELKGMLNIF
jgi:uncharacterized protein YecT (DUF1311 family)